MDMGRDCFGDGSDQKTLLSGLFIQTNNNIYFFDLQGEQKNTEDEINQLSQFSIVTQSGDLNSDVKLVM